MYLLSINLNNTMNSSTNIWICFTYYVGRNISKLTFVFANPFNFIHQQYNSVFRNKKEKKRKIKQENQLEQTI